MWTLQKKEIIWESGTDMAKTTILTTLQNIPPRIESNDVGLTRQTSAPTIPT